MEGGHEARNPGQRWLTSFDGRGFLTRPDAGGWTWGLDLESYGFAGCEHEVTSPSRANFEGGRVAYEWDAALEEWYVNDTRGLEHGYTVRRRPTPDGEAGESPLTFTLAVRGALHPEVAANRRGVRFLNSEGVVVLTYTELIVVDADGRGLNAGFERVAEGMRLSIDERGARYPLTIDPTAQQAYLKASNTDPGDRFGTSVAISGDTVVVGAREEDSNGNHGDDSAQSAGAAYVFVRGGSDWSQQAYLKASNAQAGDEFGCKVAISGDTVVVGAIGEDSLATGVNGNQSDNSAEHAGAAHVFVRNGTTWSQQAYLKASNTDAGDYFGWPVSASGDTVVVGAGYEDSTATGVNGGQGNAHVHFNSGAAYVFVRSGTTWYHNPYLKASNTDGGDLFGHALAVSGDTVVVGARGEDSGATGVDGSQGNDVVSTGAAYVFVRDGGSWTQQAYLKASNTDMADHFGCAVAASGDTVVVGAVDERSNATGVDGDQSDNSVPYAGAVYVFERSGTTWSQQAYLKASNTDAYDCFGWAVVISGDTIVIGVYDEDSAATGVNGNQADDSVGGAGAAYVFTGSGASWTPQEIGDPGVGTPCPCSNDNDQSHPGSGCANGAFASGAQLTGSGVASVSGDTLVLQATGLDPNNSGLYFQANNALNGGDGSAFGDGLRCAGGGLIRLQVRASDGSGASSTTIAIGMKGGVAAGDTKRYQCWYRDTSGGQPCGVGVNDFNLSNGYEIIWIP